MPVAGTDPWPPWRALAASGELARRASRAIAGLAACRLCARACGVDRRARPAGFCRTAARAKVASFGPHFGEEACLVGRGGSGTIFFAECNLRCRFCQNDDIALEGRGREVGVVELAAMMGRLQALGCENLNLVTPTHVLAPVLAALDLAAGQGLALPIVWNCGGYESPAALELLDGVVDVYMPDFKFGDATWAAELCGASDYPEVAAAALAEMQRQVGDLALDERGVARRGLLVRHLVLPGGAAGTAAVARRIAATAPRAAVNVMAQYHPAAGGVGHPVIGRRIGALEFETARAAVARAGLRVLER